MLAEYFASEAINSNSATKYIKEGDPVPDRYTEVTKGVNILQFAQQTGLGENVAEILAEKIIKGEAGQPTKEALQRYVKTIAEANATGVLTEEFELRATRELYGLDPEDKEQRYRELYNLGGKLTSPSSITIDII
jgi:hypothetical protein